jgi:hypothetical protein
MDCFVACAPRNDGKRGISISSQLLWNTGSSAFADDDDRTMAETPSGVETVIASKAKQSISPRKERVDCFVATLLAMTATIFARPGHRPYGFTFSNSPPCTDTASRSRRGFPREFRLKSPAF